MGRLRQMMTLEQSKTPKLLTDPWTDNLQAILGLINVTQEIVKANIPYEQRKEHPRMTWEELWWKHDRKHFPLKMMAQLARAYAEIELLLEWKEDVTELNLTLAKHRDR